MASVLQNVKATVAWRKHQLLADLNENESPVPDKFKRRASQSSLNTIRMSLRKRAPLKRVELNFHKTPTRESLEPRQRCQTLHTIKRRAKYAFGTMSQKIQKSCQSPVRSVVTPPAEPISSSCVTSSTKKRSTTPRTPCCKSVTPATSSKGTPRSSRRALLGPSRVSEHREWREFSSWLGKNAVSLRRSRRTAALKSPYSSPAPSSRKIEFDCELDLVSSGICQLKCISQAFDDAIVKEERTLDIKNSITKCQAPQLSRESLASSTLPTEIFIAVESMLSQLTAARNCIGGIFKHSNCTQMDVTKEAISNYYYLMAHNSQSVHRSLRPSRAIRRQAKKLHQALGT